ncbi:MAG: glycosyltransferase family 4 protein [Nitrospirota bacterium]
MSQRSDNKVNILLVNDHLGWKDGKLHGVGRWFLNILPRFDNDRYNVIPYILKGKNDITDTLFKKRGIRIRYFNRNKANPLTLMDFIKIIKEENIHIMHLQGFGATIFGSLAGIIMNTPVIIQVHSYYPKLPVSVKLADNIFRRYYNRVIAVSNSVKNFCIKERKIKEDKIDVLVYGIDINEFLLSDAARVNNIRGIFKIPEGYKIVGTITRLYRQKGNEFLIKAASIVIKKYPEIVFLIVGDGPLRNSLETLSKRLGIKKNIIFAGFCKNISEMISTMDIVVFPSLWEGTPLSLLETMAIGKPIVSTNVDGLGEVLKDGSGLLIPPKDIRLLSEKIIYLIEHPEEAEKLGKKAKNISYQYSIDAHVKRLCSIYNEVIKDHVDDINFPKRKELID